MIKKVLLALVLLLLLCGCTRPPVETTGPTQVTDAPTTPPTVPPTEAPTEPVDPMIANLRSIFPSIDGSTSLIPLEAGIRAAVFDLSMEDATLMVSHTSTWSSFYRLLNNEVDLVFSCPLSQEQWDEADARGVTLETVPVAMEGFVFVVNAQNPVDVLTQQQLRDIYSGKITNWSEVGGNDEPIIAYQRNNDSGSQNYMIDFMGDTPLMDAPTEMRPATMSGLMDVIAVNDNASGAIGYSVYAYAADMYGNGNEIKFIQVDGVAPSKQTFADGSYPLMGYNYAVFRADKSEYTGVKMLVKWLQTFDGQLAIAKAGYVTVQDIGFDYEEMTLSKYNATGTGGQAAEPASYQYTVTSEIEENAGISIIPAVVPEGVPDDYTYRLTQLTDTALQEEINTFIAQETAICRQEQLDLIALGLDYDFYTSPHFKFYATGAQRIPASVRITCKNGYLSVGVFMPRLGDAGVEGLPHCYRAATATWDLLTGKRLSPEALFYDGVDIDQVLNDYLKRFAQEPMSTWGEYCATKADFAGLTATGWHLTHDAIYFDAGNPYFTNGLCIPLEDLPTGIMVTEQPRDFSHCFNDDSIRVCKTFRETKANFYYAYNADKLVSCGFLSEDAHPNAAGINRTVKEYLDAHFTLDAIQSYWADTANVDHIDYFMADWYLTNLGDRYLLFQGSNFDCYLEEKTLLYPYRAFLLFDLATGEQLQWQDLLLEGWQDASTLKEGYNGSLIADPDYSQYVIDKMQQDYDGTLLIHLKTQDDDFTLRIPSEYIRY